MGRAFGPNQNACRHSDLVDWRGAALHGRGLDSSQAFSRHPGACVLFRALDPTGGGTGGAHLLTFASFWMNLALFGLESCRNSIRSKKLAPVLNLSVTCAFALALTVYGYFRNAEIQKLLAHPESTVQAGIIQANIGDFDKVAAEKGIQEAAEKILGDYFTLSDQALSLSPKPDFIIWPETSYASTFRKPMTTGDYLRDQRIDTWVKNHDIPFLFGSYDRDNGKDFNAFFVLSPHPLSQNLLAPEHSVGTDLQFYHKNMLLPFGEFIPFQDHFPIVSQWFPQVANFGRGIGPDVLKLPIFSNHSNDTAPGPAVAASNTPVEPTKTISISPLICYEVLFPNYVIDAANKGSRIIVNVTNDSWFGPNGEPDLHFALSIFRSIETRLPMIRSTNTGYSAVVLPDGEITNRSRLFEPEILNVSVPMIVPPPTLIKQWGDWFGVLVSLPVCFCFLLLASPLVACSTSVKDLDNAFFSIP